MPSLGGATGWLNSEPLGPAELRGHVVVVNFWTLTCINWLRTEPYVRAWSQAYRDDGLVVIGVHTPEFSFEHELERVRLATKERAIDYPVALDNDYADLERLRQPLLAGALLRRRGRHHPRPPLRRGALRAVGARRSRSCSASSASLVSVEGRRRGGGGRLGPPAHARDLPRLRPRRALRVARRRGVRRAATTSSPSACASTTGASPASGRSGVRTSCSTQAGGEHRLPVPRARRAPRALSPEHAAADPLPRAARRRGAGSLTRRRRRRGRQRRARATAACTSSCASTTTSASGRSRSRSSSPAPRRTCSRSDRNRQLT